MSCCNTCGSSPCCCTNQSPCSPANTIYAAACPDPGVANVGRFLEVLDYAFCKRRLLNATGYLVARQNSSGTWEIAFTTTPVVPLDNVLAVLGTPFGQLLVQGADNVMRTLEGPHTAGLVLLTNAAGQLYFGVLPAATVPDPLTVANLNVTTLATLASTIITGALQLTGLGTTTPAFILGIDGAGNVVKGDPATTGVQQQGFFESPTNPSGAYPNSAVAANSLLTIGNLIFDSVGTVGGALFTPTNSQTLTCLVGGTFNVQWGGQVTWTGGSDGNPAIQLLVNGVVVSNGGSAPAGVTTTQRSVAISCAQPRRYNIGDTIQLRLGPGSGTNTHVYEVYVNLERTGP